MLTFETAAVQGVTGIIEKLTVNPKNRQTLSPSLTSIQESTFRKSRTQSLHSRCTTFERDWRHNSHGHRGVAGMQGYKIGPKMTI